MFLAFVATQRRVSSIPSLIGGCKATNRLDYIPFPEYASCIRKNKLHILGGFQCLNLLQAIDLFLKSKSAANPLAAFFISMDVPTAAHSPSSTHPSSSNS